MPFTDASIYFVIAILGMAYPISLQVITNLDGKYSSANIMNLFQTEIEGKLFNWSLYASLGCSLFHMLYKALDQQPCPKDTTCYYFYDYLLLTAMIIMVVSFIFYTRKILMYYNPYRFAKYLQTKKEDEDFTVFKCLADVFYLSIRIKDDTLAYTIHREYYKTFQAMRKTAGENEVNYPNVYYLMVYKALQEVMEVNSKKMHNIGLGIASGRYFIGEHNYTHISSMSYTWLWNNLKLIAEMKNDDLVMEFWQNSNQFVGSALPHLPLKTDRNEPFDILNQSQVDQRAKEKDKFYEFHLALGGMLLYCERYQLLNRIFSHTMSIPYRYELLPDGMTGIFNMFIRFQYTDYSESFFPYRYQFPGENGIHGEGISKNWICRYMALLLLRQYTVPTVYYGQQPIALPALPHEMGEKQVWLESMPFLKICLSQIRDNKELLRVTGLEMVTDAWCAEKNIRNPHQLVDQVTQSLQHAIGQQQVEQPIDPEKVEAFIQKSGAIIHQRITSFLPIFNPNEPQGEVESLRIEGTHEIIRKEAFSAGQGVSYIGFESIAANKLSRNITRAITSSFSAKIAKRYLFRSTDLFKAVDKLQLDPAVDVLLNFGIDLSLLNAKLEIENLTPTNYNNLQIISIPHFDRSLISSSMLIIKKADLPTLHLLDQDAASIQTYQLQPINNELHLYGAIIDLNSQPQFKQLFGRMNQQEVDRSVMVKLAISIDLKWRTGVQLTQLELYSEFYEQGIPNQLSELE
ncbi:MAG: hypothetical protein EOO90_03630 [Pedobacter sp.]|nr:MAG: hypothetical protein EOO90_03630 [Pedobacter sp.]